MRIEDYGLIGDTQTAALVSKEGSIDWLCWPRFDSRACFAALLGDERHGCWRICPAGEVRRIRRRYRPGTMILETEFETESGTVRLVDCMPPRGAVPDLVRRVEGVSGEVPMRMRLVIRCDYGSLVPWVRRRGAGIEAVAGPDALTLHTDAETRGEDLSTVADFTARAGEATSFVLAWHPSHEPAPAAVDVAEAISEAEEWWQSWSSRCTYEGRWKEEVQRSLLTLKALTYAPTGGIVAAATTSLPELIGGVRNWDYRFCWLRDAAFTLNALMLGGYRDEAKSWRDWLLRAVAGSPSQMNLMYAVDGTRRLPEMELPWLPGFANSSPVRIGNAAYEQFQLDVFGEVSDAMHQARRAGIEPEPAAWNLERELLEFLESNWQDPDHGIWEVRGPKRNFTHSKVMAWVAFDRAVHAVEEFGREGPVARWRHLRDELHREICTRGFNAERGAFTQYYESDCLDASLLLMPVAGFLPASDPRVGRTIELIERELSVDGFLLRYAPHDSAGVDGLPPGEGAFLPCSFWLADALLLRGETKRAQQIFDRLLSVQNDLGLLSEEYDPKARRMLGNFPQAFSHVGLINTAQYLAKGECPGEEARS